MRKANHLKKETSPYLLQHAYNPVDWYPWGKKALEKAKKENKLLLISIGYSACHWCHVMEHESFEDNEVADIMNKHFVCIKVDREERPDIDTIYMTAVQLITGRGGWPLNCFTLPDGKPVYGGTYFKKEDWKSILKALAESWENDPEKIYNYALELNDGVIKHEEISVNQSDLIIGHDEINQLVPGLIHHYDAEEGGTKGAPKFPIPVHYKFFLHYWWAEKFKPAIDVTTLALDKMACGGIYDHLGGGFARYSVDTRWHVAHFEKMLYDNAQLVSLYSKAFQVTGKESYKQVVKQTIEFIQREFMSPEGGFYSALDADSEGVEGKYYTWQEDEIDNILGGESALIKKFYNVTSSGNWENNNILHARFSVEEFTRFENINLADFEITLNKAKRKLLEERNLRARPLLDDKIITSWNGLMIKALCDAFGALGDNEYLELALKCATFMEKKMMKDDSSLYRTYKNGQGKINAFLDDYALLIDAFMALYENSFQEKWLARSKELLEYVIENYYNKKTGLFYYTSKIDDQIITRTTELSDNVIPSSNSVMAFNFFRFGHLMGNTEYIAISERMGQSVREIVSRNPIHYMNWLSFFLTLNLPFFEVAITGPKAFETAKEIIQTYNPSIVTAASRKKSMLPLLKNRYVEKKNLIYVCRDQQCSLPVEDVNLAISMLKTSN